MNSVPTLSNKGACPLVAFDRIGILISAVKRVDSVPFCQTRGHAPLLLLTESELASLYVVSVGAVFDDRNYSVTNAEP